MLRRGFLIAAGVALTGCLESVFRFGSSATLSLEPVDPIEHYPVSADELEPRERTALEAAVESGEYTVYGADPRPPFHRFEYVKYEDAYYRVETDERESRSMNRYVLRAQRVNASEGVDAVEPDVYGDDRDTVVRAYQRRLMSEPSVRDFIPVRSPANETALLPEPEHPYVIGGDGTVYRLRVEDREVNERAYAVTTEHVADNDTAFLRHLDADKIATVRDDKLTEKQREVLNTAIEEDRYTAPPDAEPRSELVDIFQRRGEFDVPSNYDGVVKYNGEYYGWDSYYPHD